MWAKHKRFNSNASSSQGFTIVELLIVIIVIGILAAITIVAYNGVQSRAQVSAVSSALTQAAKKIALWQVDNPNRVPTNLSGVGVIDSENVNYQYTVTGPSSYCLMAAAGSTFYKVTESAPASAGGCTITNLMANPSFESNTTGWGNTLTTIERMTGSAPVGSAYLRIARNATGDAYVPFTIPGNPPANTPYTLSYWIWADTNVSLASDLLFRTNNNGSCCASIATKSAQAVTTTPTRVVMSGTTGSNPTSGLQIILRPTITIGQNIYYDGFMVTYGSFTPNYADGSYPDWSWGGTVNNSASSGLAI